MKQLLNSTSIPNKLLEQLFIANSIYNESEKDMLLYICRKTIGWQKQTDWLTLNLIVKETNKKKSSVSKTLKSLFEKQAITKEKKNKLGWAIGLNLDAFGTEEKLTNDEPTVNSQLTNSSLSVNATVNSQLTPSNKTNTYTKQTITNTHNSKELCETSNQPVKSLLIF
jgi:phage replication O-like protein O